MFADSSGEDSQKTFGFTNDMLTTISSAIDSTKSQNEARLSESHSATVSASTCLAPNTLKNKVKSSGELTTMTEEEKQFFVEYQRSNRFIRMKSSS